MSDDGADLNVTAEQGMKAVIGGEKPTPMTDAEFAQMIRTAERVHSYDGCANRCARLVLEYLETHPEAATMGSEYHLFEILKRHVSREDRDQVLNELSGFMWGWAVNAARHILKLKAVPNPAIVTINV